VKQDGVVPEDFLQCDLASKMVTHSWYGLHTSG